MDIKQYVSDKAKKAKAASKKSANMSSEIINNVIPDDGIPHNKVNSLIGAVSSGISDLGSAHREHIVRRMKTVHVK